MGRSSTTTTIRLLYGPPVFVIIVVWVNLVRAGNPQTTEPCTLPQNVLSPVSSSFKKLIPQFNLNAFSIQFKTDARISMTPTNPALVPFLIQYPSIALNQIGQPSGVKDVAFRNGMTAYFNSEYGEFLSQIGLPVACISLYSGAADVTTIKQLEALTKSLTQNGLTNSNIKLGRKPRLFAGVSGEEIAYRLNLAVSTLPFTNDYELQRTYCDKIFWTLKDGTVVANMPTMDPPSRQISIPTSDAHVSIFNVDVTHEIAKYFAEGVNCMDDYRSKKNFSATVGKWMSLKLIPQILQHPSCITGFPKILPLLVSIEKYQNGLEIVVAQQRLANPDYDDYQQPETYYPPLQAVKQKTVNYSNEKWQKKLKQEIKEHHPDLAEEYLRDSNAGILSAAFIIFVLIALICCCIIPLCYYLYNPKAKTFVGRMADKARDKLAKIISQVPYNTDQDEDDSSSGDENEALIRQQPKSRFKRKHRVEDNKKCRTKIAIPITSDTSYDICVVTTEVDECDSTDSDQSGGYISKEMDVAGCRIKETKRKQRNNKDFPFYTTVQKNYAKSVPAPHKHYHGNVVGRHERKDVIVDTTDIEARYNDSPVPVRQTARYQRRATEYPQAHNRNEDMSEYKTPHSSPPPPQTSEEFLLPPEIKHFVDEEHRRKKSKKSEYYDKLIKEWKYRQQQDAPIIHQTKNLGSAPPPRKSKKQKSARNDRLPF